MLDAAQAILRQNYGDLLQVRQPLGHRVHALEHGLSAAEIKDLASAASEELKRVGTRQQSWLVWVALAAEAGYRYRGDEYWPEFEVIAREWSHPKDRTWIRKQFERFKTEFHGPHPEGSWARHFNIISWPIANAILPRYLQATFAQHLFEQRHSVTRAIPLGAASVGQLLVDEYQGNATRFALFLRQTSLTGQIVLALRDQDLGGTSKRITPDVLNRIVSDLEVREDSRSYLRSARKVLGKQEAKIASSLQPNSDRVPENDTGSSHVAPIRLAARRHGATTVLGVIFPNVLSILEKSGFSARDLSKCRVKLPGANSPWEPALSLLTYAGQDRKLSALPVTGDPVVTIEGGDQALHKVTLPSLTLAQSFIRLLKCDSDGLYREMLGGNVRSGQKYILVANSTIKSELARRCGAHLTTSDCIGAFVYSLDTSDRLSDNQTQALKELGIGTIVGMRIEPIGLSPSNDEHGIPTWLTSEPITLRLSADFEVAGFRGVLECEGQRFSITTDGMSNVSLGNLERGTYRFSAEAISKQVATPQPGQIAKFDFQVSRAKNWQTAMREKAGFRLSVVPQTDNLEQVLNGRSKITILGPTDRKVRWSMSTYDASGTLQEQLDGQVTRVGSPQSEIDHVVAQLSERVGDALDVAHRVDLTAFVENLGRDTVTFSHDVSPVRWVFDPQKKRMRLVDETDEEDVVTVSSFSFEAPANEGMIRASEAKSGFVIKPAGSLLVARRSDSLYPIFVSVPAEKTVASFADLKPLQSLKVEKSNGEAVLQLLKVYDLWSRARPVGPLAILRKKTTLAEIRHAVIMRSCGPDLAWALQGKHWIKAQKMVGGSPGFGLQMRKFRFDQNDKTALQIIQTKAERYKIARDENECREAYALVFAMRGLRPFEGEGAIERIENILRNQKLLRGMFLAHAAASADEDQASPSDAK